MIALRVIKIQECSLLLQILKSVYIQPRFIEPLYNEVLGITNDILQPGFLKCMEQDLDITNQFP